MGSPWKGRSWQRLLAMPGAEMGTSRRHEPHVGAGAIEARKGAPRVQPAVILSGISTGTGWYQRVAQDPSWGFRTDSGDDNPPLME
jgi:hypothetical protein